jgi:hypothetical protein
LSVKVIGLPQHDGQSYPQAYCEEPQRGGRCAHWAARYGSSRSQSAWRHFNPWYPASFGLVQAELSKLYALPMAVLQGFS